MFMSKRNGTAGRLVYTSHILSQLGISDRSLRRRIKDGRFPRPDGNVHGRNFWLMSSYTRWVAEAKAALTCRLSSDHRLLGDDLRFGALLMNG
jgi:predicted DNA-binding transcriptional regulator AlpA